MLFCIPRPGDEIVLKRDWTFTLFKESRNTAFAKATGEKFERWYITGKRSIQKAMVTLPKGTALAVDHLYLSEKSYAKHAVTFKFINHPKFKELKSRIWVKLDDVNNIECDPLTYLV